MDHKKFLESWRFKLGFSLIILSLICPIFILLVLYFEISAPFKVVFSALLSLGIPEILILIALLLIGKDGILIIKNKVYKKMKPYAPPKSVSRLRYYIGLTLFILPLIYSWFDYISYLFPDMTNHQPIVEMVIYSIFIMSFYILGGDFLDKIRALFIYEAKAQFPEK